MTHRLCLGKTALLSFWVPQSGRTDSVLVEGQPRSQGPSVALVTSGLVPRLTVQHGGPWPASGAAPEGCVSSRLWTPHLRPSAPATQPWGSSVVSPCQPPTGRTCKAAPSSQGLLPCLLWSGRGPAGGALSPGPAPWPSLASQWLSLTVCWSPPALAAHPERLWVASSGSGTGLP